MKFLGLFFLFTNVANAATEVFDLNMHLTLNKEASSFRIITEAGKQAEISQKTNDHGTFIETVAVRDAHNPSAIEMKFVIGTIGTDGKKKIISTPQIIARENQEAKIESGDTNGTVTLSVTAKRAAPSSSK